MPALGALAVNLLTALPPFLVIGAGLVLSLVQRKRLGNRSTFTMLGFAAMTLAAVLGVITAGVAAFMPSIAVDNHMSMSQVAGFYSIGGLLRTIVEVAAWILLLIGIFRKPADAGAKRPGQFGAAAATGQQFGTTPAAAGQPGFPGQPGFEGQPAAPGQAGFPGQPGAAGQPAAGQAGFPAPAQQTSTQPGPAQPAPGQPAQGQPAPGQPGFSGQPGMPGQPGAAGQQWPGAQPGEGTPYGQNPPYGGPSPY
ncbi:MAG TPA: hypothetical protein VGN37_11070 [Actinocatenispora sp.]